MSAAGRRPTEASTTTTLGWREWAQLPGLGVRSVKAKLDTGARTSALHAFDLREFVRDGVEMVRFEIHPLQRSRATTVRAEAVVVDHRTVRNSGGQAEMRPVISAALRIGRDEWPIEITLTRRDEMGFRMLLGRQALRDRIVIDPGRSYCAGRRPSGPSVSRNSTEEE
ncbi:MAG: ATP-dependent zinc protease family protein [Longimicrobiales bacterium]